MIAEKVAKRRLIHGQLPSEWYSIRKADASRHKWYQDRWAKAWVSQRQASPAIARSGSKASELGKVF
jgi:hypothetical protein